MKLFLAILVCLALQTTAQTNEPLRLLAISPLNGNIINISGRIPLTLSFNRPVVDFEKLMTSGEVPNDKVPLLQLQDRVNGTWKWLTSSFVQFTPLTTWPTDLNLRLNYNPAFKSSDNISLELPNQNTTLTLVTPAQRIENVQVFSTMASSLTDGAWNAFLPFSISSDCASLPSSECMVTQDPEVPSDGNLLLYFASEMDLNMVNSNWVLEVVNTLENFTTPTTATPTTTAIPTTTTTTITPTSMENNTLNNSTNSTSSESDNSTTTVPPTTTIATTPSLASTTVLSTNNTPKVNVNRCYSSGNPIPISFRSTFCLNFTFEGLQNSTRYRMRLPSGTRYNSFSDPLSSDLFVEFWGLFPFRFSFLKPEEFVRSPPRFTTWRLFLRHGLSPSTAISDLQQAFTFQPSLSSFNVSLMGSYLQLSAPFQPNTLYNITINASESIKDGFGLPLQSSSASFLTDQLPYFRVRPDIPNWGVIFEDDFSEDWIYLLQNGTHCDLNSTMSIMSQPFTAEDISSALCELEKPLFSICPNNTFSRAAENTIDCNSNNELRLNNSLLNVTGTFIVAEVDRSRPESPNTYFVVKSDLAVSVITTTDRLVVWVTTMSNNSNVANANITFHSGDFSFWGLTDENGIAVFPLVFEGEWSLMVERDGKVFLFPKGVYLPPIQNQDSVLTSIVILDRKVYKPGDVVFGKGYIQAPVDFSGPFPSLSLLIRWEDQSNKFSDQSIEVNYDDPSLGSFSFSFNIPLNLKFREYQYIVDSPNSAPPYYVYYADSLMVSDPRPTSAFLDCNTTELFYDPEKGMNLNCFAGTNQNQPLANYTVEFSWKITQGPWSQLWNSYNGFNLNSLLSTAVGVDWVIDYPGQTNILENKTGSFRLVTNADGNITNSFLLPFDLKTGDCIQIIATLISPSGFIIENSLTRVVSNSAWRLVVSTTHRNPIPNWDMAFLVDLTDQNSLSLLNYSVNGAIYQWSSGMNPSDLLASNTSDNNTVLSRCTFQSNGGKVPVCQFKIPQLGKFIAIFTYQNSDGANVISAIPFGKTQQEWNRDPLRKWDGLLIDLEKSQLNMGEELKVNFVNPFSVYKMLILWGSAYGKKAQMFDVYNGDNFFNVNQFSIPIGAECGVSCAVRVVCHAPRRQSNMTLDVPTSPLFDWNAPAAFSSTFMIHVIPPQNLTVQLNLLTQSGNETQTATPTSPSTTNSTTNSTANSTSTPTSTSTSTPAASTGSKQVPVYTFAKGDLVNFTVQLTGQNNQSQEGEIAVMVVDSTVYNRMMTSKLNTASDWQGGSPPRFEVLSSQDNLALASGYRKGLDILRRRMGLDPFIVPRWDIIPQDWLAEVDMPDELFLENHFYLLTYGKNNTIPLSPLSNPINKALGCEADQKSNRWTQTNWQITPFFEPKLSTTNGQVSFSFQLPLDVQSFDYVVKVLAVNANGLYGMTEARIISRESPLVSLETISPKRVRLGDLFQCGLSASLLNSSAAANSSFSVLLDYNRSAIQLMEEDTDRKDLDFSSSLLSSALFSFRAITAGVAQLNLTVVNNNNNSTLEFLTISFPVMFVQEPVFSAVGGLLDQTLCNSNNTNTNSSSSNNNNNMDTICDMIQSQGIKLPNFEEGTAEVKSGYGFLPAISLLNLYVSQIDQSAAYTLDQLVSLLVKPVIDNYNNLTGIASDLKLLGFDQELYSSTKAALSMYGPGNSPNGLRWTEQSPSDFIYPYVNTWGLIIDRFIQLMGGERIDPFLTTHWRSVVENVLQEQYSLAASNISGVAPIEVDMETLSMFAFASEQLPLNLESLLIANYANLSLVGKLHFALYLKLKNQRQDITSKIYQEVQGLLVTDGNAAYIATTGDAQSPLPDYTATSMFLYLTLQYPMSDTQAEKMAVYLARFGRRGNQAFDWQPFMSKEAAAWTLLSLSSYDLITFEIRPILPFTFQVFVQQTETASPNATTSAPNATTSAPNATTSAPNATTSAPNGTTSAPETTTSASETTTSASETTTSASETTTSPSTDTTTFAPPETTPTSETTTTTASTTTTTTTTTSMRKRQQAQPQGQAQEVLSVDFSDSNRFNSTSFSLAQFDSNQTITIKASGEGQIMVAAGFNFVPASGFFFANENSSIWVNKLIQVLDPSTGLPSSVQLNSLTVGSQVLVTIEIDLMHETSLVQISDSLVGCLEVLGQNEIITPCTTDEGLQDPTCGDESFFSYFQKEILSDKVRFHGTHLSPGSHVVSYKALVTAPGTYVIPPTLVFDKLNPEYWGVSPAGGYLHSQLTNQ